MKTIKFFVICLMLMAFSLLTFGQTAVEEGVNYEEYFYTFGGFVLLLGFVTEFLKNLFNLKGIAIQIVSWVTGVLVSFLTWWLLPIGIFENVVWWGALAIGFAGSLVSNGVFDAGLIEWILKMLKIYSSKKIN